MNLNCSHCGSSFVPIMPKEKILKMCKECLMEIAQNANKEIEQIMWEDYQKFVLKKTVRRS